MHRYMQGILDKKNFETIIFKLIFNNYHYFHLNSNEEERMDYLGWLYPRLTRAIDAYHDTGSSFDVYLSSTIYWGFREYRSAEHTCWTFLAENALYTPHSEKMKGQLNKLNQGATNSQIAEILGIPTLD
jgi:hypothetical protein